MVRVKQESQRAVKPAGSRSEGRAPAASLSKAIACALLGTSVLLGAVAGIVAYGPAFADRSLEPHPRRLEATECRRGRVRDLACIDADDAVRRLGEIDPNTEEGLIEATRIFAAAILHDWPSDVESAVPDRVMRFYEDLPLWCDMIAARARGDLAEWRRLAWLERGRWRSAIRIGVGACSHQAIAISDYLRERGVDARPFGLGGHVVALARTAAGEWIVDPDFALVVPRSLAEAGEDPEGMLEAYLAVGAWPVMAAETAATFGPAGNAEYAVDFIGSNQRRLDAWKRRAQLGAALCLVVALALWRLASTLRLRAARAVPSA
ncbi:MAG: hypothetical protein GC172_06800 [Phycisphaera sp.]|nr:hypothetical protein [Phycisphaera sp.]